MYRLIPQLGFSIYYSTCQKHPVLAIDYLAQRPTVLPGYPPGLDALFGEIAAVEHPDRPLVRQWGTKILLQAVDDRSIDPASLVVKIREKALGGPGPRPGPSRSDSRRCGAPGIGPAGLGGNACCAPATAGGRRPEPGTKMDATPRHISSKLQLPGVNIIDNGNIFGE